MTKRSLVFDALRLLPEGSGVAPKSRLRAYSASGFPLLGLVGTVSDFAFALVKFRLDVVAGFFDVRGDALAEGHVVAFNGALGLFGSRGCAVLQLVAAALEVCFQIAH